LYPGIRDRMAKSASDSSCRWYASNCAHCELFTKVGMKGERLIGGCMAITVADALPTGHPGGGAAVMAVVRDPAGGTMSVFWGLGVASLNDP
jgi:hypothetical protein